MSTADEKREARARRQVRALGCRLLKSRARTPHYNNQGGYQIVSARNNVLWGDRFEVDLSLLERLIADGDLERAARSHAR